MELEPRASRTPDTGEEPPPPSRTRRSLRKPTRPGRWLRIVGNAADLPVVDDILAGLERLEGEQRTPQLEPSLSPLTDTKIE